MAGKLSQTEIERVLREAIALLPIQHVLHTVDSALEQRRVAWVSLQLKSPRTVPGEIFTHYFLLDTVFAVDAMNQTLTELDALSKAFYDPQEDAWTPWDHRLLHSGSTHLPRAVATPLLINQQPGTGRPHVYWAGRRTREPLQAMGQDGAVIEFRAQSLQEGTLQELHAAVQAQEPCAELHIATEQVLAEWRVQWRNARSLASLDSEHVQAIAALLRARKTADPTQERSLRGYYSHQEQDWLDMFAQRQSLAAWIHEHMHPCLEGASSASP